MCPYRLLFLLPFGVVSWEAESDVTSFVQIHGLGQVSMTKSPSKDLVMMHVPFNFGTTIAKNVALGSHASTSYMQVSRAASKGWDNVNGMMIEGGEAWGPINPDLHEVSNITGCSMYYTPQKLWPSELAQKYFGSNKVIGVFRDPYERVVSMFRGHLSEAKYQPSCDVNGGVKQLMNDYLKSIANNDPYTGNCQFLPQSEFLEGKYGVELPIDNRLFPDSANVLLHEHGYDYAKIYPDDIAHVAGCDNEWVGDLDDEAKELVEHVYAKDFDFLCEKFQYCTKRENTCLTHIPGMCPEKLFTWDEATSEWTPKTQ